jgi:transcriptional enhancer factor
MKYELPSPLSTTTRQTSLSPHQESQYLSPPHQSLRPSLFKMYMTTLRQGVDFKDVPEDDAGDGKLSTKVHTYSDSIPRAVGYSMLEMFPDWQTRFPILAQIHSRNELKCDVIHVEASLELRYGSLPERSELWGRFELLAPGKHNRQYVWRCTQSLFKPADLYGAPTADPRFENVTSTPIIDRYEPGVGTHIRVSFPALSWAYTLQRLSTLEAQFDEAVQTGAPLPTPTTARQYIDQITMFQEIFCSEAPNQSFSRKAILLWTFKKCKAGEQGRATWRYLYPSPPRSTCFSPHPGATHVVSAAMSETFAAWAHDSVPPHPFDPLSSFDSLATPSLQSLVGGAADMQFPFPTYGYPPVSAESLSFMSHETQDGDSTLVDARDGGVGARGAGGGGAHVDSFLSAAGVLAGFDQGGGLWEAGTGVQGFESDPAFLAGYGHAVPGSAGGHIWDGGDVPVRSGGWDAGEGGKHESWDVGDAGLLAFDALGRGHK